MNNKNTSNIPFEAEVCNLALKQLKTQVNRLARYETKKHQNKVTEINRKRQQIASRLYHFHGIEKDELYLFCNSNA